MRARTVGLASVLRERAEASADQAVHTWLTDGCVAQRSLSFAELDLRARAIATRLRELAEKGDRALLLYRAGLEFIEGFLACLYSGVIAVPAYAVHNTRQSRRIESMAEDAQPLVVLSTSDCLPRQRGLLANRLASVKHWLAADSVESSIVNRGPDPCASATDVAYLQYTSGSTATPKGVVITHSCLVENLAYISSTGDFDKQSQAVSWLPHFHDMGLVYGWLQPLYEGFHAYHMAPASFTTNPVQWLRAITDFGGTHCGGPNFAFDLCAERVRPEDRHQLDLRSWRVAFTGAEPIQWNSLERFIRCFEPCGFERSAVYPVYGLAEATLKATSVAPGSGPLVCTVDRNALSRGEFHPALESSAPSQNLVGCGYTGAGHMVEIVDPDTAEPTAPGKIGEIWFSGPSVAAGYWNRPAETEQTFRAAIRGNTTETPYLRTGDLGAVHEGQVFVVGRLKETIIIRGRNYYPQDIEAAVEWSTAGVRTGSVIAFGALLDDTEQLVVAAETSRTKQPELNDLAACIRRSVADECELQVYGIELLRPGGLERTSSGKRRRNACRAKFIEGSLPSIYSWRRRAQRNIDSPEAITRPELLALDAGERVELIAYYLRSQLAQLAGIEESEIGLGDVPASLGVDSMVVTDLAHRIERDLDIKAQMPVLLGGVSIRGVAAELSALLSANRSDFTQRPASAGEAPLEYTLSSGQKALWFLQNMRPLSTAWNITRGLSLHGPLDQTRLRHAVQAVVDRHPVLRTTFHGNSGAPVQRVEAAATAWFEWIDISDRSEEGVSAALVEFGDQPFRLDERPPFRVAVWKEGEQKHILLVSIHHIISDLWSLRILWKEIFDVYAGGRVGSGGAYSYADYVGWQQRMLDAPEIEHSLKFWDRTLKEPLPSTTLLRESSPKGPDRPRGTLTQRLSKRSGEAARQLASQQQSTLFGVVAAAMLAWLHRETGQADVLIGTTTHGRTSQAFRDVVGYFANTLPIRAELNGSRSFADVVATAARAVGSALEHGHVPFPVMVERSRGSRDSSLLPAIQVMFVYHAALSAADSVPLVALEGDRHFAIHGFTGEALEVRESMTQFDLTVTIAHSPGGDLAAVFDYDRARIAKTQLADAAARFVTFFDHCCAAPDQPIQDITLLPGDQRDRVLFEWNNTERCWDAGSSLPELLAAPAASTPDAVAVSLGDSYLTYYALDERARAAAAKLRRSYQPGTDDVVAICCDRSLELMVALVGILRAGAAYLPLDPDYPTDRLQYMLERAGAAVLLCERQYLHRFEEFARIVCLEDFLQPEPDAGSGHALPQPANLAYVIFTSGSTGRPKGVMVGHEAICNRLLWMKERYALLPSDVLLQKTPITFDVSVWELFLPLISGAQLALARPGGHRDPKYLADVALQKQVTMMHFIPRMLRMTMEHADLGGCGSVRNVFCSGEVLPHDIEQQFLGDSTAALHNLYGPTEAAVDVSAWQCIPGDRRSAPPIGKPISNTRLYVLDDNMQPVPPLCPGHLHIGGIGLARGYIGAPALTASSFVPDPFSRTGGERLYRTGDLAMYDAEGNIGYLGRIDTQVKIRGFRVETGEIETMLRLQPGVSECAVQLEKSRGEEDLVAYLVAAPEFRPSARELRASLAKYLPEYMIPTRFVTVAYLPLSPNGKLDRGALATVAAQNVLPLHEEPDEQAGLTATEQSLMQIWSGLLNEPVLSTSENFFALGGHSLLAMRMAAEIRESFRVDLPLESVFAGEGTIAGIAEIIDGIVSESAVAAGV